MKILLVLGDIIELVTGLLLYNAGSFISLLNVCEVINLWVLRVTHKIRKHRSPMTNDNYRVLAVKDRAKTNIAVKLTYLLNIIAILDL